MARQMQLKYDLQDFGDTYAINIVNKTQGVGITIELKKDNQASWGGIVSKECAIHPHVPIDMACIMHKIKEYEKKDFAERQLEKTLSEEVNTKILPDIVNGYVVPHEKARQVMSSINRGKNVMIVGQCGCGKSRLVQELAKHYGQTLVRINLNGGTTDASLVGEKGLRSDTNGNTETYFQYGALPNAMKNGYWLLLDEMDFAQPEYLAVLQAVFEGNGTPLTLLENGGEKIYPHPNFRIIATANTLGRGDKGGYHGTNMLNIATLDRWSIIKMSYTKEEATILMAILANKLLVDKIMKLATRIRESIEKGVLQDFVLSTRRLIHWAESIKDNKMLSFREATELELTGRLTQDEDSIIAELIRDEFGV